MNFINPLLLLFAAAASVPLLLHLFNRQRIKVIEFSTIKYLRNLQKTRMRKLKIRQILLLILRTLILLTVAIAFARPTVEGGYFQALGGKSTTTAVVLMDISASMGAESDRGTLFEREVDAARKILNSFTQKEKSTILAFGSDVIYDSGKPSSDFERQKQLLASMAPSSSAANPALAFSQAFELLQASSDPNLEIYLISDLQGDAWKTFEFNLFGDKRLPFKLFVTNIDPGALDNVSVDAVKFPNQIVTPGRDFSLQADVVNYKKELSADLLVALELDGKKVAQSNLSLPPAGSGMVSFSQEAGRAGFMYGQVGIDDDDIMEDNRYYFGMRIPSLTSIALITDNEEDAYHLQQALAPLAGENRYKQVDVISPAQAATTNLFNYDVLVVAPSGDIPSALISSIRSYLNSGGGVLFLARPDVNLKTFSAQISSPIFGLQMVEPPPAPNPDKGKYLLSKLDLDHPIFSPYREFAKEGLPQVEFYSHFKVLESPNATVLARFSDNTPAVLEGSVGKGRAILYTFSPDNAYTDLSAHPLMVVMLNRTVEYLVSEPLNQRELLFAGDDVTRTLTALTEKRFALVTPQGDTSQLSPSMQAGDVIFNLGRLQEPGIYRILGDDKPVDLFAVNFPPEESTLEYLPVEKLTEKIPGARLIPLEENADAATVIASARFGKELWKPFVFLGFIFLLLEMAVAKSGKQPKAESS